MKARKDQAFAVLRAKFQFLIGSMKALYGTEAEFRESCFNSL